MENLTTGQRIAECRKSKGLSQEGLGEKMGVSRQAISKWEADAAMPDVDKLIALSKLFSVSVGWLLGVEELPQPEATQVSDELLHKIETVVQQYQPKKKSLPLWKKLLIALSVILLLVCARAFRGELIETQAQVSNLSSQLHSNHQQNSSILSQLSALENRINSINDTIEQGTAVLAEYEFQINPDPAAGTAYVHMNAVPKTWKEDWSAVLSVRYEGLQTMSQTCAWDGSALVSGLKLNLLDGYEFWLVITYPDGSMEQVQLPDEIAENLKRSSTIICDISRGNWSFTPNRKRIWLENYDLYLAQPMAMEESRWIRAEFYFYHIREGKQTLADTEMLFTEMVESSLELWTSGALELDLPELQNGDRLELWFEAELENGLSCRVMADGWTYQNGEFRWDTE